MAWGDHELHGVKRKADRSGAISPLGSSPEESSHQDRCHPFR